MKIGHDQRALEKMKEAYAIGDYANALIYAGKARRVVLKLYRKCWRDMDLILAMTGKPQNFDTKPDMLLELTETFNDRANTIPLLTERLTALEDIASYLQKRRMEQIQPNSIG